jgi:hypothetical protein
LTDGAGGALWQAARTSKTKNGTIRTGPVM